MDAKCGKNELIVNLGDIFQKITNNSFLATRHRVKDIGCIRYSSPFFFDPQFHSCIPLNILLSNRKRSGNSQEEGDDHPIVFGKWLINKITTSYGEWKNSKLVSFIWIIIYSIILFYTILNYTILYYTILHYIILYYTILYYTIL